MRLILMCRNGCILGRLGWLGLIRIIGEMYG